MRIKAIIYSLLACSYLISCQSKSEQEVEKSSQPIAKKGERITIFTTAEHTACRLTKTAENFFTPTQQPLETEKAVFVNSSKQFQKFIGIGGAITDASAETFAKLSYPKQQELLQAYYTADGISYSLLRTTIHSSDFSSESYTYVDEGDKDLTTFSIEHDKKYRLPLIKQAMEKAGGEITIYASPWSPPAFMKGKKDMLKGGTLLPEFAPAWANYYAKFIKAYEKEGVPIWGLTIQNEPMAKQTWESCIYTAEEERDFLKNHLGPTLKKEGLDDTKIIVWDHNRDLISHRANTILNDPEAAQYVWGVGFHWYETWAGGEPKWDNLKNVQESFPDKKLLFTEGCNEKFDATAYQRWNNAERYGLSMINDFNQGTVGWTDWNILLDQTGGPNHVGNFCFAPIHADTQKDSLIYTPAYYYIGHFSKFIHPEARRVSTTTSHTDLQATSFLNKDGKMATVVMNQTDKAVSYKLIVDQAVETETTLPAHSIQTFIY